MGRLGQAKDLFEARALLVRCEVAGDYGLGLLGLGGAFFEEDDAAFVLGGSIS